MRAAREEAEGREGGRRRAWGPPPDHHDRATPPAIPHRSRASRIITSPRARLLAVMLGALSVAPDHAEAQRRLTLPQVTAPHPYYWRELYLPQLTTGPSAAAWSPDGNELVYSMRGTLWRQRVDGDEAVQLTDAAGYDYQPDWSPDGRFVVFARYTGAAIELHLLDVASGAERPLRADGAVHVEPRFSPDGTRLAWVSTAHEGRFHVWTATINNGTLGTPVRVTEDRDAGLPRYYYSRWDQYLSPSWSPDGRELLVVANTGKIWGTGGLWRIPVGGAGAEGGARPVWEEETSWKARPDWSPDGRRVAFASYAGRQWHQLALVAAGRSAGAARGAAPAAPPESPVALTYGDFDATAPRWSRDGRRIAYVSNERGNTSLWVISLSSGERREVVARRRRWKRPAGALRLVATDAATGAVMPARLSVRGADGRHVAPDDAWIHADEGFDRRERRVEFAYFHADAPPIVTLPAGRATVEAMRGLEFAHLVREAAVRAGETTTVRLPMRRLDDPAARGWISGDLHVHMNYGGSYRNTPERLVRQARAEGVRVVENLIVNKESRVPDVSYFSPHADPASARDVLVKHDEEFHTSYWGHLGLLGLTSHLLLPPYSAYQGTAFASPWPTNAEVARAARAQGALAGYVHPHDVVPDPANRARPLTNDFPVTLALGLVDYYEAVGFVDDFLATQRVWYAALNAGFRLPAGAGTDAMMNYAALRGPVGMNRVYARVRGPLTHRTFLDAIRAGRTVATNAPLLEFTIDGHTVGDSIALPAGRRTVDARVRMRSFVAIDSLEIVSNGTVVARVPTTAGGTRADARVPLAVEGSAWFLLRGWTPGGRHPVLDGMPIGTTSPIYVTVGGAPIRSVADTRFFLAWIERVRAAAEAHPDWNDERERREALAQIDAARRELERRLGGARPATR